MNAANHPAALLPGSIARLAQPAACRGTTGNSLGACLDANGYHRVISYLPPNRFRELQGFEGALYPAAASPAGTFGCR